MSAPETVAQQKIREARERANMQSGVKPQIPQPEITKTADGKIIKRTVIEEVIDPSEKVYYAKVPNTRYVFSDGTEGYFSFGKLVVSKATFPGRYQCGDPKHSNYHKNGRIRFEVYQEELDEIIGRNPMIYVENSAPLPQEPIAQNSVSESAIAADEAKMRAAAKGHISVQQDITEHGTDGKPTDVSASSMDKELQAALFANQGAAASNSGS